MSFNWCGELEKLEDGGGFPPCLNPYQGMVDVVRQFQPDPASALLKQGLVLLAYRAMGGNPGDLVTMMQGGNGKKSKPRKQGICRDLVLGKCNPLNNGGEGCRKNTRLTGHCALRSYFAKKDDGTISTKLSLEGLQLVRDYKLRQMNG